jgi:uncharacterized cupredoxin-like copper-binding protein
MGKMAKQKFELTDVEKSRFHTDILDEAIEKCVRPCILYHQRAVTKQFEISVGNDREKRNAQNDRLANPLRVIQLLTVAYYGASGCKVQADRTAGFPEGTVSRMTSSDDPVCIAFCKAWDAVRAESKLALQITLQESAEADGWLAKDSLKTQHPDEYQNKQTIEMNSTNKTEILIKVLEMSDEEISNRKKALLENGKETLIEMKQNDAGTFEFSGINDRANEGIYPFGRGGEAQEEGKEMALDKTP